MEPTEALNTCENALRNIIGRLMGDAWQSSLNSRQRSAIQHSKENEEEGRHGVNVSDDLLAFTDTLHLTKIIEANWPLFAPVFKNETRTRVSFEALNSYRRTAAHNRELRPFERDLLSGISGQIRNQVALYLSEESAPAKFYPLIESVVDSHGNLPRSGMTLQGHTKPRLQVGDVISFDCRGVDPRGLNLHWALKFARDVIIGQLTIPYGEFMGERVTLSIAVTAAHVGEDIFAQIQLRNDSPFRRRQEIYEQYDDARTFQYAVDPPPV
jgi:hypothetical protein